MPECSLRALEFYSGIGGACLLAFSFELLPELQDIIKAC